MTLILAQLAWLCLIMPTQEPPTDLFGDPLPDGAVVRLGTERMRHGGQVNAIAFSPDGKHVLSGAWDRSIVLWDVKTARRVRTFEGHKGPTPIQGAVWSVAFSPDGKRIISGSTDLTMILWDVATASTVAPSAL